MGNDNTVLLGILLIGAFLYGGQQGWFTNIINVNVTNPGSGGYSPFAPYAVPTVTPISTPTWTPTITPTPTATSSPIPTVTPIPTTGPLLCGQTAAPMCNGTCPSGQHCLPFEAAICACYPTGDSSQTNFGYSSCQSAQIAMGKDFYVTGVIPTITSLNMCEAHAQAYCQQFGWWVTILDWAPPDCCVWSCSGNFG